MNAPTVQILQGDCRAMMATLPAKSVDCCVTSPPYWNLRNYGTPPQIWGGSASCIHDWVEQKRYTENSAASDRGESFHKAGPENAKRLKEARWRTDSTCSKCRAWRGELGLEPTPEMFIANLVEVFREVWRVLKDDGTLWLNLGDSYAASGCAVGQKVPLHEKQSTNQGSLIGHLKRGRTPPNGLKQKDLVGIPWMAAFALRSEGWYLRSDIIWSKPNCMPESVTDRPTRAHEYIFLLSKSAEYYYDAASIRNPPSPELIKQIEQGYNGNATKDFIGDGVQDASATKSRIMTKEEQTLCGSNKRTVWNVSPAQYRDAHFATFPPELIKPCILAGSRPGGVVIDPFTGSGTTGEVSIEFGRSFIGCELQSEYLPLIDGRLKQPGLKL